MFSLSLQVPPMGIKPGNFGVNNTIFPTGNQNTIYVKNNMDQHRMIAQLFWWKGTLLALVILEDPDYKDLSFQSVSTTTTMLEMILFYDISYDMT